jgi:hypothetical protein
MKTRLVVAALILLAIANAGVAAMSPFDIPPYGQPELLTQDIELEAPTAMAFDSKNRPYLLNNRNPESFGLLRTVRNGEWVTVSLRSVLGDDEIPEKRKMHALGELVIDDSDALYATIGNTLIYSPDLGKTLKAYTCRGTLELRSGPNSLSAPPAISIMANRKYVDRGPEREPQMAWWATRSEFSILLPIKDGEELRPGAPIPISDNSGAAGSGGHSGGTSFAVTSKGKTHVVWNELPDDVRTGGNLIHIATVDHATRTVVAKKFLVKAGGAKNDNHTRPTITMDSRGYLHVLSGSHNEAFYYLRSLVPNDITSGWTEPVQLTDKQCYASIVCDERDSLHTVYREWLPRPSLGYASTFTSAFSAEADWSPSTTLVNGRQFKYGIFYHRLFIDRASTLYLSFTFLEFENGGDGYPEALVVSTDYGRTWQLARKDDFISKIEGQ